jgi:hypothetical protein
MSAQEINVAIAELCGWKNDGMGWWYRDPLPPDADGWQRNSMYRNPPNYYGCLNACAEMEATLKAEQWMSYLHYIYDQVPGFREGSYWYENFETQRQVSSATAPQRSIAFLRVHGKWSDA